MQFGGKLDWDATAICGDDQEYGGLGHPSTGERFHAAPNIDHKQPFVREGICEWLNWLRQDIGIDGYRLDFAKGFGGV
jgi:alpha-amylase